MKVKEQLWSEPEHDTELIQVNDMHISKMSSSRYIKKEDVEQPILVTISKVDQQDVSMENEPTDMKWVLHFSDHDKPMVLNKTNIALASLALQSEETDSWITKQIVLFNDATVMFAGNVTGGVRIRAPKLKNQEASTPPPSKDQFDDDIPF